MIITSKSKLAKMLLTGDPATTSQAIWRGEPLNSMLYVYFPTGQLQAELEFKNGKVNGQCRTFFALRPFVLKEEYSCVNDQPEGLYIVYDMSGTVRKSSYFNKGALCGPSKEYDKSGNLKTLTQWKNGNIVRRALYKKDGSIDNETYFDEHGNLKYLPK